MTDPVKNINFIPFTKGKYYPPISKTIDEREVTLNQSLHWSALHLIAFEEAKDLLERLEKNGYLEKKDIVHEGTSRLLLEEFLKEILEYVIVSAKVGSKVTIKAFKEEGNLKIEIVDDVIKPYSINTKHSFSFSDLIYSLGWNLEISKVPNPHIIISLPGYTKY